MKTSDALHLASIACKAALGNKEMQHTLRYWTKAGRLYAEAMGRLADTSLKLSRALLRRSDRRCTWCGAKPGFRSTVSARGIRCDPCSDK
jgi:hypothetical protein